MVRSVGCGLMMMRIQRTTVNAIANLRPTRITRPTLQNGEVVGQKDIGEARPEGRGRDEVERVPLASVGLPAIRSSTMRLAQVTVVVPIAVRSSGRQNGQPLVAIVIAASPTAIISSVNMMAMSAPRWASTRRSSSMMSVSPK
jgi:hypothetical protein